MLHLQVRAIYEKRCESCLALLSHARELFHQEPDTVRTDKGKNNSRQHSCSLHSLRFFFCYAACAQVLLDCWCLSEGHPTVSDESELAQALQAALTVVRSGNVGNWEEADQDDDE